MNDRQLRSFVSAAEHRNFIKAANEFGITSPALINQINTLEKDINLTLFNRNTHGIELTREGRIFYKAAKDMLKIYEQSVRKCKQEEDGGLLNLAICRMHMLEMNSFVMNYKKKYPDVQIAYKSLENINFEKELSEGECSFGFLAEPKYISEDFRFIPTKNEVYSVLIPEGHPLSSHECVSAEDLKEYTVECGNHNGRKVNPAEVLERNGIRTQLHKNGFTDTDLLNMTMNGKVVLLPCNPANADLSAAYRSIGRVIPTNIPAGRFGFGFKQNSEAAVSQFITEYIAER